MSLVVEMTVAAALFLAVGGDAQEAMRASVWEETGVCEKMDCEDYAKGTVYGWCNGRMCILENVADPLKCLKRFERCLARRSDPSTWDAGDDDRELTQPEWVPSAVPTDHKVEGYWYWWKLQL
jgi:hypothetical protein